MQEWGESQRLGDPVKVFVVVMFGLSAPVPNAFSNHLEKGTRALQPSFELEPKMR